MTRTDGRVDVEALERQLFEAIRESAAPLAYFEGVNDQIRALGAERDTLRAELRSEAASGADDRHWRSYWSRRCDAAERARDELAGALQRLRNEASGSLYLSGVREAIGNTNFACMEQRIAEADEAIARHRAGSGEESNG